MSKFLDPYENAKRWGILGLIAGVWSIGKYVLAPKYDFLTLWGLAIAGLSIATGYGLMKGRLWGLQLFIVEVLIGIATTVVYFTVGVPYVSDPRVASIVKYIGTGFSVISVLLAIWFYSARKRFKK